MSASLTTHQSESWWSWNYWTTGVGLISLFGWIGIWIATGFCWVDITETEWCNPWVVTFLVSLMGAHLLICVGLVFCFCYDVCELNQSHRWQRIARGFYWGCIPCFFCCFVIDHPIKIVPSITMITIPSNSELQHLTIMTPSPSGYFH